MTSQARVKAANGERSEPRMHVMLSFCFPDIYTTRVRRTEAIAVIFERVDVSSMNSYVCTDGSALNLTFVVLPVQESTSGLTYMCHRIVPQN